MSRHEDAASAGYMGAWGKPWISFRNATLCSRAYVCTSGRNVSTETRAPRAWRCAMTGARRSISTRTGMRMESGLLATAPRSMTSAPASSRLSACEMAACWSRKRPPSENESSVMLTMPSSRGEAMPSLFSQCVDGLTGCQSSFEVCEARLSRAVAVEIVVVVERRGHVFSPSARRKPATISSRCSGFRK